MLTKVFLLCFAFAYANCQLIFPGAPGCGCNAPLVSPPCNGPVEVLAPVAGASSAGLQGLLQLLMQRGALAGARPALPANLAALQAPRAALPAALLGAGPTAIYPEIVMNSPVTVAPACGCGASQCSCNGLCNCGCGGPALGCPNLFLPAASPMSAMSPQLLSPALPPVCPCQNKCQFLRKIPIPPPSI
ncbi:hypothetical protein O0L34_g14557 [Tuta absoluta]|nr:hypothetical protein O0L34_g14557 [Tuta absoluta]